MYIEWYTVQWSPYVEYEQKWKKERYKVNALAVVSTGHCPYAKQSQRNIETKNTRNRTMLTSHGFSNSIDRVVQATVLHDYWNAVELGGDWLGRPRSIQKSDMWLPKIWFWVLNELRIPKYKPSHSIPNAHLLQGNLFSIAAHWTLGSAQDTACNSFLK